MPTPPKKSAPTDFMAPMARMDGPPAAHNNNNNNNNARQRLRRWILFTSLALSLWSNASLGTSIFNNIIPEQTASDGSDGSSGRSNWNDHHDHHNNHHHNEENDVEYNEDWDRLLSQGTVMALRLATNDLPQTTTANTLTLAVTNNNQATTTTTTTTATATAAEWEIDIHQLNQCDVVYSFGVGKDDPWTNLMARYCRRVYAFDPTVSFYPNPNVTFYPWGLWWRGRSSNDHTNNGTTTGADNNAWSHPVYGSAVPEAEYLTFPQVQARLLSSSTWSSSSQNDPNHHHHHRSPSPSAKVTLLSALKFDCEGCEYAAFRAGHVPPTQKLYTEFHFATTLGMRHQQDVAAIATVQQYLNENHCTVDRFRPNRGFRRDRSVLPYLVDRGVPNGTCCYEYVFTCHRPNNNNNNNHAGVVVG